MAEHYLVPRTIVQRLPALHRPGQRLESWIDETPGQWMCLGRRWSKDVQSASRARPDARGRCQEMSRDRRRALIAFAALGGLLLGASCEDLERRATAAPEPMRRFEDLIEIDETTVVAGQTLYVPAYSQIPVDERRRMPLAVSLSVRNTDDQHSIAITSVRYYASSGELLEELIPEGALQLDPMASATHAIGAMDRAGGEGANFVVEWVAAHRVSPPIVESVMVSTGTQGISFVSRGEVIRER